MFCRNKVPTAYFVFCFVHLNHKKQKETKCNHMIYRIWCYYFNWDCSSYFFIRFRKNSRTENEQNAAWKCHAFQTKISTSRSTEIYRDVCRHYSIGLKIHPHNFPISKLLSVILWLGLEYVRFFPQTQLLCKKPTYIISEACLFSVHQNWHFPMKTTFFPIIYG